MRAGSRRGRSMGGRSASPTIGRARPDKGRPAQRAAATREVRSEEKRLDVRAQYPPRADRGEIAGRWVELIVEDRLQMLLDQLIGQQNRHQPDVQRRRRGRTFQNGAMAQAGPAATRFGCRPAVLVRLRTGVAAATAVSTVRPEASRCRSRRLRQAGKRASQQHTDEHMRDASTDHVQPLFPGPKLLKAQ